MESWELFLNSAVSIFYPQAVHNREEEDSFNNIKTFAGIYLSNSKHDFHPSTLRLIWHLTQRDIADTVAHQILNNFKFISRELLTIIKIENFDKNNQVQLIALRFSNQKDIEQGSQLWLINDESTHQYIRSHSGEHTRNAWLPWFKEHRPEFLAKTPIETMNRSVVAHVELNRIFDRKTKQFMAEPILTKDIIQASFDILSPPVRNFMERQKPLFAFLLFKHSQNYQLMRFEVGQDGRIETMNVLLVPDPWLIGLPSAQELGFSSCIRE